MQVLIKTENGYCRQHQRLIGLCGPLTHLMNGLREWIVLSEKML